MENEIKEGVLVKILHRYDLPNSEIADSLHRDNTQRVPFTKFEFKQDGAENTSKEYFPMHLDQLLEGERIKFGGLPSGFLDYETDYQMRIKSGANEGQLLKTGCGPTYNMDKVRELSQ